MNTKHSLYLLAVAFILVLGVTPASAEEGQPPQPMGQMGMFQELSPEQMDMVRNMFTDFREERYRLEQKMSVLRSELNLLIIDENASDQDIEAKIVEISQVQADMLRAETQGRRTLYLEAGIILPERPGNHGQDHRSRASVEDGPRQMAQQGPGPVAQ